MGQLALGCDGVELLLALVGPSDWTQTEPGRRLPGDNGWHGHEAQTVLGQKVYKRSVIKFSNQPRANAYVIKPLLQVNGVRRCWTWEAGRALHARIRGNLAAVSALARARRRMLHWILPKGD